MKVSKESRFKQLWPIPLFILMTAVPIAGAIYTTQMLISGAYANGLAAGIARGTVDTRKSCSDTLHKFAETTIKLHAEIEILKAGRK